MKLRTHGDHAGFFTWCGSDDKPCVGLVDLATDQYWYLSAEPGRKFADLLTMDDDYLYVAETGIDNFATDFDTIVRYSIAEVKQAGSK